MNHPALHTYATIALVAALTGCLETKMPANPIEPMCELDTDCDYVNGEVCGDGICWGNPPETSQFALVLEPATDTPDLARTDLTSLDITRNGTLRGLVFDEVVTLSGRVMLACDVGADPLVCDPNRSIAATIRISRPARFPGGPEWSRTVIAAPDVAGNEVAFRVEVPRSQPGEEPYEVLITPDDGNASGGATGVSPAELAPPLRFDYAALGDKVGVDWTLGEPSQHKIIQGRVVDAVGVGLPGMQVFALGRWDPLSPLERASSITMTDEQGYYWLRSPIDMLDIYDIVAQPEPGKVAPSLRALSVYIPDPKGPVTVETVTIDDLRMPGFAQPVSFGVPVLGTDSGGDLVPVPGAKVELESVLVQDARTLVMFSSQGFTDANGNATLTLIPGAVTQNRSYRARVTPPADSLHAALYAKAIDVGPGNPIDTSFLAGLTLAQRVGVGGTIVRDDGTPVENATVTARVSTWFRWHLELGDQALLSNVQLPEATTDASGQFLLWLDPTLLGKDAEYDLAFSPPARSGAPRWTRTRVSVANTDELDVVDLGTVPLPSASYARGMVRDASGQVVPGAEVRLYQLNMDSSLCDGAIRPASVELCEPPAILRGVWRADDMGQVQVILPVPTIK